MKGCYALSRIHVHALVLGLTIAATRPVPRFVDGELSEIRFYPITLGFGKPRAQRGRPLLADPAAGRRIVEQLRDLSSPFGTEVRYLPDQNVGIVTISGSR